MKRPWGTGSVTPTSDGRFRARLPPALGRKPAGVHDTEEAAHGAIDAMIRLELERPTISRTVNDAFNEWMNEREARENTKARDRGRWQTYAATSLGTLPVYACDAAEIDEWWTKLRKDRQLSALTLGKLASIVRSVLPKASASAAFPLPKRTKKLPDWLREHEIVRVLGCQAVPLRLRLIYAIRIYTGLRPGELWGLRWEDVDLERDVLHVRRSRLEAPKTHQEREVGLLSPAKAAFLTWREMRPGATGLVFPSTTGTVYSDWYDAEWYEHRRLFRLGRPFTFYDLRHTCASHLLQGTWAPRYVARAFRLEEVQDVLGHEDIATTQRYAHLCADGRHALLVRDAEQDALAATPGIRTPDLRFTKAVAEGPDLRVIEGGSEPSSRSASCLARAIVERVGAGLPVTMAMVLELCGTVADEDVALAGARKGASR